MARLYHPNLGTEYECPDDEGLLLVLTESGWELAPEPEVRPGYEPEPVKYEPVVSKAKRAAKTEPVKGEDTTS